MTSPTWIGPPASDLAPLSLPAGIAPQIPYQVRRDGDAKALLRRLATRPGITVAVSVYNGGDSVRRCIDSVLRNTQDARVIVIDDASTDPTVVALLDEVASAGSIKLVRHEVNRGYTRTINHAVQLSGADDLVLLNSDTTVGPLWLQRLLWVAYSRDDVATVTAVSDNAGAMAVPVPGEENYWPEHLSWDEIARGIPALISRDAIEVPTGNGFCMLIRRQAFDRVGIFDEEAFPRGYGEENDFCMRARAAGLVNLAAARVLVHHERNQSFGEEKQRLVAEGRRVVDERHPTYTRSIREWLGSSEMAMLSADADHARTALRRTASIPPRRLYVLHRAGGGTTATNRDLLRSLTDFQEAFLLDSQEGTTVRLHRWNGGELDELLTWTPDIPFSITDTWRPDYAAFLAQLITDLGIEVVHVRHLIMHPLQTVPRVCRLLGVSVLLSTHDYYFVCPTVHLLDDHDRYCGGICTPGVGRCRLPAAFVQAVPPLKHRWIGEWQRRVRELLGDVDAVVATTRGAAQVLGRIYGDALPPLHVIEHGRALDKTWSPLERESGRTPGPLRVVVPANWDPHKGTEYLRELAKLVGPAVEWHVLGKRSENLDDVAVVHGPYERDGFRRIVDEIDPDLVGIFSIWPETYSHVLTEAWALGVPVVATDIGAVAERIGEHGGGFLLPLDDVPAAATLMRELAGDSQRITAARANVPRRRIRSLESMAEDYRELYDGLSTGGREPPKIGYVAHGGVDGAPGSTHIRLLRRLQHPAAATRARWRRIMPRELRVGKNPARLAALLVQRDSVPDQDVYSVIEWLAATRTRLIVEVDDDLVSAPAVDRLVQSGYSRAELEGFLALLREADLIMTSTSTLAARVEGLNDRVRVFPNVLDERLWIADLEPLPRPEGDERRVLYMGTVTHQDDLELVREVFTDKLSSSIGAPVVLEVVGGQLDNVGARWFRRLKPSARQQHYPNLVRWLRTHARRWDMAIAPLVDTPFNGAKSDLKLLEYALLDLPTVASDVGPYHSAPEELAIAIPNERMHWSREIARVLEDDPERLRVARAARRWVMEHRLLSDHIDGWTDAVLDAAGLS